MIGLYNLLPFSAAYDDLKLFIRFASKGRMSIYNMVGRLFSEGRIAKAGTSGWAPHPLK